MKEGSVRRSLDPLSTLRPFEYVGSTEHPEGIYNGHDLRLGNMDTIYSVGRTPTEAVEAFCRARGLGEMQGPLTPLVGDKIECSDNGYTWSCRFRVDGGTGMKAAGIHVPGGVVCTWWK